MLRILISLTVIFSLTSCVSDGVGVAGDSIYFKSQAAADAALIAFDKQNPSCQLWTNWQKMCSRTGPNGETYCVTDPDKPVNPSAPFCVKQPGEYLAFEERSLITQKSILLFCAKPEVLRRGLPTEDDGCLKYSADRPFNGRRYSAFSHPWCAEWKEVNTKRTICREGAESEKSCSSIFPKKNLKNPTYCASWTSEMACRKPSNTYFYQEASMQSKNQPPDSTTIEEIYGLNRTPIVGIYCGHEIDGK